MVLIGANGTNAFLAIGAFCTRDDVVDAEEERGRFDCRLVDLQLDGERLPDAELVHVDNFTGRAVNAHCPALFGRVL